MYVKGKREIKREREKETERENYGEENKERQIEIKKGLLSPPHLAQKEGKGESSPFFITTLNFLFNSPYNMSKTAFHLTIDLL